MRGRPLSPGEIDTITDLAPSWFPSQIAKCISARFPEDNGGHRSPGTVSKFMTTRGLS